jgi:hypothetical protein
MVPLQAPQGLRVQSSPKQGEVADVPMDLASRQTDALLGFRHHRNDFGRRATIQLTNAKHCIGLRETDEELADVLHQGRIGHPELRKERVFRESRKETLKDPFGGPTGSIGG